MDSPTQRDAWGERLPRRLGLWSAVAVLVGSVIGSGIFRVPAAVAAAVSDPGPVLLTWAFGGLLALCGALTLAELAAVMTRLPQVLVNVPNVDKSRADDDALLAAAVAEAEAELGESGRVLLRPSGTEPLVRVMVEAETAEQAQAVADRLATVVRDRLSL